MSIAEFERFSADVESNEALRNAAIATKAERPQMAPMDRMVTFAASKGYGFTVDDIKAHAMAKAKASGKQLTDEELDGVAGGFLPLFVGLVLYAAFAP
jgi:predicted ribosomally synthesized peptide with nif11-like leader